MKVIDRVLDSLGGSKFQLTPKVTNQKIANLYRKAKRDQWNLDDKDYFPKNYDGDINEWLGISDEVRLAAARSFSSFYYGEQGAKLISAQLSTMAPTSEAAKFLATQTMDEARHVEVFERMLNLIDEIHPMNPFLNAFLSDIYRAPSLAEKLVGMNLLVEGLALSAFRATVASLKPGENISEQGYKAIGEPIEAIIRDESRHVGFGVLFLPDILSKLNRVQKAKLRMRQMFWLCLLYGSVKYHQKDQELMGINYLDLLNGVIEDHERRVQECGGDALVSADTMKLLIPRMDKLVDRFL
jgi:hypothetical protein